MSAHHITIVSASHNDDSCLILTLQRSQACPVRDVLVSFLRTDPEKSPPSSVLASLFGVPSDPDSLGRLAGMLEMASELRYIPSRPERYKPFKLEGQLWTTVGLNIYRVIRRLANKLISDDGLMIERQIDLMRACVVFRVAVVDICMTWRKPDIQHVTCDSSLLSVSTNMTYHDV